MEKTKTQELEILNNYFDSGKNQIVIVYGHRRTGSQDVLLKFAEDKQFHYYYATSASERLQQHIWGKEIRSEGHDIGNIPSYTEIFEIYEKECKENGKPMLIFIENFEDIIKNSPEFLEEVSKVIFRDGHPQMMLILMGSNSAWIENNMVEKIGKQASYISGFLKLKPYSFQEMKRKHPKMSTEDAISTYALFGGKANLWEYFDEEKSFRENVCEKFLDVKNSVLIRMTNNLLQENLRETAVYNTILYGLANGRNKLNDIHHATNFSRAKIMVYLKSLIELGMVEKVFSFATTGHENVQKGVYRIIDPLADFYFRFLYQNISRILKTSPEEFYDEYIEPNINDFVDTAFKLVCREYVLKLSEYDKFPFKIDEEGEWVGKFGTINIVAQSETGDTLVALTSWGKELTVDSLEFLRNCSRRARLNPDYYYLFSSVGFDDGIKKIAEESPQIKLIGLDDLMNE